jgi:hypothetical protein
MDNPNRKYNDEHHKILHPGLRKWVLHKYMNDYYMRSLSTFQYNHSHYRSYRKLVHCTVFEHDCDKGIRKYKLILHNLQLYKVPDLGFHNPLVVQHICKFHIHIHTTSIHKSLSS